MAASLRLQHSSCFPSCPLMAVILLFFLRPLSYPPSFRIFCTLHCALIFTSLPPLLPPPKTRSLTVARTPASLFSWVRLFVGSWLDRENRRSVGILFFPPQESPTFDAFLISGPSDVGFSGLPTFLPGPTQRNFPLPRIPSFRNPFCIISSFPPDSFPPGVRSSRVFLSRTNNVSRGCFFASPPSCLSSRTQQSPRYHLFFERLLWAPHAFHKRISWNSLPFSPLCFFLLN